MALKSSRWDSSSLPILAEFPCGRTALASGGVSFTRSLQDRENSTLQNATLPSSFANTTAVPSTPVATTTSFPATNDPADMESPTKPPQKADGDEVTESTRRRIVGGDVVVPGEIPWQVLFGGSRVKNEACVVLLQQMHEGKQTVGMFNVLSLLSALFPFCSGSLGDELQRWDILRGLHSGRPLGYHCRSLPAGHTNVLLCQSG